MTDCYIFPMLLQILEDKSTVAMLCGWFAAKQYRFTLETIFVDGSLDVSGDHQDRKFPFINIPIALLLLVCIQDVLRRRQQRFVFVTRLAYLVEKVGQVGLLGETGELRGVVQPN